MSELKAMTVLNAYQLECNDDDLVYLKSEADKVIADLTQKLNNEIEHRKRAAVIASELKKAQIAEYNVAMHHKYKRCLTMAELCGVLSVYYGRVISDVVKRDKNDKVKIKVFSRFKYCKKWLRRWRELAEKFKE